MDKKPLTEEEIKSSPLWKGITEISKKYEIRQIEEIRDQMTEASKKKGYLTTAEINMSLTLLAESLRNN